MNGSILVVLSTLQAEGTPVLALDLVRLWRKAGLQVAVVTLFAEPTEMRSEFEAAGAPIHCLNVDPTGPAKFLKIPLRINILCRSIRPDAILCFPFGWHGYLTWAARLAGVRHVVAHAGNYPPTHSTASCWKMAFAAWLAVPFGSQVACCSNYVRQGILDHLWLPAGSLQTVYNGIDLERFQACSVARPIPNSPRPRCGMVARLEGHKDQPTLIRAMRILLDRGVKISLELVGDGSRRKELEALINELGLADNVCLLGTRRDIPELLRSWDLFIFSATASEGLGIALVEALAAGIPVIASDVGACREVLCPPGEQALGTLVSADSAEALAAAIAAALSNRSGGSDQALRARESVTARFGREAMASNYLALLAPD